MKGFVKKHKIRLAVAIFVGAISGFIYFLAMPSVARIIVKADNIQQKKIDKELNEKKLSSIAAMEEDYLRVRDNADKFDIIIEPSKELDFIKELELLAEQTGNRIEFKVQDPSTAKPVAKSKKSEPDIKSTLGYSNFLTMQIALEGNYVNLLNFINKLENRRKYVNIITISSEKRIVEGTVANTNPFAATDRPQEEKKSVKETINSILDVVVYIKK
ncbi:MAG: hypothetical protein Q8L10_05275 [Candidatus Moranbacteria bacterium]|nr:hypothetical protein [Candidatus Moranbacteria bacterium]